MPIFPRDKEPTNERRVKNGRVNEIIKKYADGEKIVWLDFNDKLMEEDGTLSESVFPDFLHPNEIGYRVWAEAVKPFCEN
jgi:beta-glucosidase